MVSPGGGAPGWEWENWFLGLTLWGPLDSQLTFLGLSFYL